MIINLLKESTTSELQNYKKKRNANLYNQIFFFKVFSFSKIIYNFASDNT